MASLRRSRALVLFACVSWCAVSAAAAPTFEKDVLPIFSTYCFTCHGKSSPELGLDLRTATSVLRGGFNGPVIEKGSAEESRLYQKVSKHLMPPPAFNSTVPDDDLQTIRNWIETGAEHEDRAEIPEAARKQISRFEKEIQPIFNERCVACHGGEAPQSGLDLRSLASLLKGGKHGPVISEGFSEKSVLVRQLRSGVMPPSAVGKPLGDEQIELIREWIDGGNFADYIEVQTSLDRAFTEAEAPEITEQERNTWAFRKPTALDPPSVKHASRVATPIDSFVLAKLEEHGLELAAPASKQTLLRRAYFDLWGLPPTPEQAEAFLNDAQPDAYERLIDRLLDSPKYGERWGRHWLDSVGYIDTWGKDFQAENVNINEGMWRYRDYVIEAFNEDKPWDRFLTEQIAGDELVDWRNAEHRTPEMIESLVATGYLRTILDVTNEDISDRPSDRYDAIFALMDKVSSSALGLTVSCARCHTHKFDPIPQRDYYRFLSLFTAAYNPSAWIQPKKRLLYTVSQTEQQEIEEHNKSVDEAVEKLSEEIENLRAPYRERLLSQKLEQVPEAVRSDTQLAVETAVKERDDIQKYLIKKFGKLVEIKDDEVDDTIVGDPKDAIEGLQARVKTWAGYRRKLDQIQGLWDGDEGMPTIRLLQRGSVESPGPRVTPGFISVLCDAGDDCSATPSKNRVGETSGYRLALAEWLTSADHPLGARVVVNRIWQHHFGTGIVATPGNFGATGSPPSHPQLLDWLAVDFVKHGWKAKRLHKQIMMSAAYRQSSRQTDNPKYERAATEDSQNALLWRMPLRRLEAEALRDSVLAVAGRLDTAMGGPSVGLTARPDGLQVAADSSAGEESTRRSVYLLARRTWPLTFLQTFDFPIIDTACSRRVPSATPLQSLTFMNSEFVIHNAREAARRVLESGAQPEPTEIVDRIYALLFSRKPSHPEAALAVEHLESQEKLYARANSADDEAFDESVASLVHMLLSSNEFLYVD